jgi:hypothetical protein
MDSMRSCELNCKISKCLNRMCSDWEEKPVKTNADWVDMMFSATPPLMYTAKRNRKVQESEAFFSLTLPI